METDRKSIKVTHILKIRSFYYDKKSNYKKRRIKYFGCFTKKGLTEDYSFYYSQFFGKKIEIEKISASKIIEVMNKEEGDEYEKYKELIYLSCPLFRAKELIKELEVDNPYDVVSVAFNDNYAEVFELGNRILQRYGFTSDRLDKVKK